VVGKVQRYMRHAVEPMPARYDNYNLLEHLGTANVFTADFLATVELRSAARGDGPGPMTRPAPAR
jgi:hypothetical protein